MTRPRLLQVCNVGQICSGTAACAWTVTRALAGWEHQVAVLGTITAETRRVFAPVPLLSWPDVSAARLTRFRPDIVLLHNTAAGKVTSPLRVPKVLYQHSQITVAAADRRVFCSRWLAERCGATDADVLWQAVPRAVDASRARRADGGLTLGRICTPRRHKWPQRLVGWYRNLALRFPQVQWEFVGCPTELQSELAAACGRRARFYTAGWDRRALLTTWDAVLYHQPELPESFGRVVAEAMRVGCVPIVDRLGGFIEQLDEGGGYLCATAAEFASAISELSMPELLRQRSQQCREIGNRRWSLARFARDLLREFDAAAQAAVARRNVIEPIEC